MTFYSTLFFICSLLFHLAVIGKTNLKILYVLDSFPKITETFIIESIAGMLDRGHNVSIYAVRRSKEKIVHPLINDYDLFNRIYFEQLPADIRTYDIVLCQFGVLGCNFPVRLLSNQTKMITCIRGSDITQNVEKKRRKYEQLFKRCDLFLPVCEYFKTILKNMGCPEEKICVHGSSINCSAFPYQERQLKNTNRLELISIGRLVPKKGRKTLIQAISILKRKYPHVHLTIVGNGAQKEILVEYVRRLGLQEHITFVYTATQGQVRTLLEQSDIFILTSETASDGNEEGIPNALKEAMAIGVPVIATDHAGNPELITHKKTGLLIAQKNPKEVVGAVEWLINNVDKWPQITKEARLVSERYDRKRLAKELETIFFDTLARSI